MPVWVCYSAALSECIDGQANRLHFSDIVIQWTRRHSKEVILIRSYCWQSLMWGHLNQPVSLLLNTTFQVELQWHDGDKKQKEIDLIAYRKWLFFIELSHCRLLCTEAVLAVWYNYFHCLFSHASLSLLFPLNLNQCNQILSLNEQTMHKRQNTAEKTEYL